ncbi:GATA zinc finger domain-containing protein 14-like [Octopus sinensis]|uniref:GATA zinc finger domain-containing protein 14-like n=1 Tax=Octopus sinensis TaxID=2607531 RepID=A0A7E6EKR1_9MOLL|nr:GATA zinc finger domain-containing protein 14-like [Octopus sinensis]
MLMDMIIHSFICRLLQQMYSVVQLIELALITISMGLALSPKIAEKRHYPENGIVFTAAAIPPATPPEAESEPSCSSSSANSPLALSSGPPSPIRIEKPTPQFHRTTFSLNLANRYGTLPVYHFEPRDPIDYYHPDYMHSTFRKLLDDFVSWPRPIKALPETDPIKPYSADAVTYVRGHTPLSSSSNISSSSSSGSSCIGGIDGSSSSSSGGGGGGGGTCSGSDHSISNDNSNYNNHKNNNINGSSSDVTKDNNNNNSNNNNNNNNNNN